MNFRQLKLRKDPNLKPITELIDYQQFCGVPSNDHEQDVVAEEEPFQRLDVSSAKAKLDAGWAPYVLDVRRPAEAGS